MFRFYVDEYLKWAMHIETIVPTITLVVDILKQFMQTFVFAYTSKQTKKLRFEYRQDNYQI